MKGSSRNKDHSTEGEGTGKRPKRKCLQWHPLLAKKLLDFSEEEEEEEEEDDIDKVPLLGTDGLEQDADETEDDESSEQRARRPMNAFLLFCKRHRSLVRKEHPRLDNRGATKILADWWAVLDPKEKQKYTDMAKEYKDAFMKANPGYKWCPTTNKPVKTQSSSVTNRKKLWAFASDSAKDLPSPRKVTKSEEMPQLNFGMADPTQMGGLSMLLLAGEHALTAQEVSSATCQSDATNSTDACQKSSLFQFAEISSNTSQLSSSEPVKHCGKSTLFQLAEISSSTSHSAPSDLTKQCGTSALFQLAEMCLASEGVKMKEPGKTKVEAPEDVGEEVPEKMEVDELEKTTIKDSCKGKVEQSEIEKMQNQDETKAEESETAKCRDFTRIAMENSLFERNDNTKDYMCFSPELSMADISILRLKPEKIKKKKKKNKLDRHTNEKSTPKKTCKKRQSSESDIESVMYTIEAVAKGDWGAERLAETPRKKPRPMSNVKGSMLDTKSPKKKVKSKEKKTSKEKPTEPTKESKPPDFLSIAVSKEVPCEVSDNIKVEPLTPTEEVVPQSLPGQVKAEDSDCVKKIETCGSRKSERSCKGALYKTLVSEGMLTSLRANVDRGKRSSGKGNSSDHEGCWNEENWAFSQSGTSGNKKLKKPKPKEEFGFGLAKLEEEFEKKFNSLPQYSPITFDRKNSAVPRKKRKIGSGSSEQPKSNKGSFQSQKKNLFHKIVSKCKHRKEKLNVPDTAILLEDRNSGESAWKNKISISALNTPEPAMMHEPLVGSQKRKARKTKITHLVRTADGRVSPAGGSLEEKPKELPQSTLQKTSSAETDCNSECSRNTETEENHSITSDMPAVSAFFSLAALAEVAAMENVHRSQRATPIPHDGQPNEMSQAPVLISCADQ
ncbi:HMG box transcription factor BBX isoform X1 [Colius striatus]|uniref:HMG box transcription factor BBX isoform X1 n=1 Tax=Colius striatus TaxID=57412 RepID=UPI002B1DB8D9|nr:HMG box transcription factor BBX isoform X1 [Colius striatus]XP_061859637.1 HMG box transcription factor BBX isoform X1 [Colius striatus]XP_061859645.1 HMG box transcription factor BBX isoform X1 [Colius striatus]XP_061859653.1 HMG box transcription factor BBX isoform X1 [Colius striatus]XP_061859659.1 HMG box transcription factor BBX isoform X1 [Colius striatus]XP_061859669.1 HMG box transcription factor BBX isoform X1 [Colius striatus]XP_061859675.1 HMG box transcription factor BBX isofo